jgi:hypothetical protein
LTAISAAVFAPTALAGWCDDKLTGFHCRQFADYEGSQQCRCESKSKWKTDSNGNKKLKTKRDCDSVGDATRCANGCDSWTGYCISDDKVCGTKYESTTAIKKSCPDINTEKHMTWKSLMTDKVVLDGLMETVEADVIWFNSLVKQDLFQPHVNSTYVKEDKNGTVTVTLPGQLQSIAEKGIPKYRKFTGARNLPECKNDKDYSTDCEAQCKEVSNLLGEYAKECMALAAAANKTGKPFDASCYTLKTLPVEDGGCEEPWCTVMNDGAGIEGQGWQRNCEHLCLEQKPGFSAAREAGAAGAALLTLLRKLLW